MRKTKIKTCFCFLDLALAFIKHKKLLSGWKYSGMCYSTLKPKEIFALSEREAFSFDESGNFTVNRVILSCCVKCATFQIFLKVSTGRLDQVKCLNTIDDDFSFTEEEIFVGYHPNEFYEMTSDSESECEAIIDFPKKVFTKSCFTHSKLDLERYCSVCKETFTEEF